MKIVLFTFMLAVILLACRQEFDEPEGDRQFTVGDALAWYEANKPGYIELKSGGNETKVKYVKPDWSKAIKSEKGEEEIVETDILTNGGFGFATEEMYNKMKTLIFMFFFAMFWINSVAQVAIDTLDIETSYNDTKSFSKSYHIKNQNHFSNSDKTFYPIEIDGDIFLSPESKETVSGIILETLPKEKVNSFSGKRILLSLIVNSQGEIKSVMIGLDKKDASSINFTKQECKQIMQIIKKDVKFDVVREFKYKERFISISVPVLIK